MRSSMHRNWQFPCGPFFNKFKCILSFSIISKYLYGTDSWNPPWHQGIWPNQRHSCWWPGVQWAMLLNCSSKMLWPWLHGSKTNTPQILSEHQHISNDMFLHHLGISCSYREQFFIQGTFAHLGSREQLHDWSSKIESHSNMTQNIQRSDRYTKW